jgi:glycosyltransferase involved in cell wall biosynthesis/LmbE family N-acetylglucosaminyl deacetylase
LESDLIPYKAVSSLPAEAALVLAPHPDDEIFGCGGAIASHVRDGIPTHIVILTDGSRFGEAGQRASESLAAAKMLGYGQPEFWGLPDRELYYSEALVQRVVDHIGAKGTDLVYAPSPWEIHPDHRQTTWIAIEAVRRVKFPVRLAFYEVGSPLRPNLLLDITESIATKEAAMRCFESQLSQQNYIQHIQALNRYRTYTLPRVALAAEAYWVVTSAELDQANVRNLFTLVSLGSVAETALLTQKQPLVSILIRSMNRKFLSEALDSIALQTYSNIEVVVVAATPGHDPLPAKCGPFNLRLISTDTPLLRSSCANKAMSHARGSFLLFLDDDDWLMPSHIARLAQGLELQPHVLAIYTGISLVDVEGKPINQTFDLPFDAVRQMAGNLMPIHAVLFSSKVLALGCQFDESLDLYEDWDFWLQLAKLAPMVHLPGVSGAYRIHESSGVHSDPGAAGLSSGNIYQKWEVDWTREQIGKIMQRVWSHPEIEARLVDTQKRLTLMEGEKASLLNSIEQMADVQTQRAMVLAQQEYSLSTRTSATINREYVLEKRQSALAEQELLVNQKSIVLTKQESIAAQRESMLVQREAELATQMQAAIDGQQAFESMARKAETAASQLAQKTQELAAVYGSRSWRVTRPLRESTNRLRELSWFRVSARRVRRLLEVQRTVGFIGVLNFLFKKLVGFTPNATSYSKVVEQAAAPAAASEKSEAIALRLIEISYKPVISVVMPVYNPPLNFLRDAISSVQKQQYSHWELCIADDASSDPEVLKFLSSLGALDTRIKVVLRPKNGHIAAASNSALAVATGDFVALLDHDDILANDALYWVVEAINQNMTASVFYSDEDKIGVDGKRCEPYFKSDWNLELFLSQNMISHLGVYRRSLIEKVGRFRPGYEGSQDYDLALRCILKLAHSQIVHIPRVLYHWRILPGSTALSPGEKTYAQKAGHRALSDYLEISNLGGQVESLPNGFYRVHPALPDILPLVSLIIPTRNALQLVQRCINSILAKTTYFNYEILLIDNGSDDPAALAYFSDLSKQERIRVIRDDSEFNYSALNNRAVSQANGELIGLINNDIEVISPGWLGEMVGLALRPGVGAVGAKLLYPNDTLQHGGIILGLGGVAGHSHLGIARNDPGYFGRAVLTQSLSAVTAACLVVRKSTYEEVRGLNEIDLKVAFNDVDFCLKLTESGYRNVWTPYAEMYHHESATRGADDSPEKKARFANEVAYMHQRWGHLFANDPYYNINLTLTLPSFAPVWPPRQTEMDRVAAL